MDISRMIQLISMNNVLNQPPDYRLRLLQRWFSKTYYTPLYMVSDMSIEDLLMHYFESTYQDHTEEERQEIIEELLESDEARAERLQREEQLVTKTNKSDDDLIESLKKQSTIKKEEPKEVKIEKTETVNLNKKTEEIPELQPIEMKFDEDFEAELAKIDSRMLRKKDDNW